MRILVVIMLVLAGCVAPDFTDPGLELAMPHGGDHDHADPDQHRHARNARLVDTLNLQEFGAHEELVVGAHAMAVHGDMLAVAVFGNHDASGGQQGFHLINISDPENLVHEAFYSAGVPVRGDRTIAFSSDGQIIFLGIESGPRPGIAAVDVGDTSNVHEVGFWADPVGYGPHTVAAASYGGTQFVYALSYGVTTLAWDGSEFTERGRYITSDNLAIADAGAMAIEDPDKANAYARWTLYGHDMNLYQDPISGLPLLLVAYAYDGLKILDMSTPEAPVLLARFLPEVDGSRRHYVHSATAERIDGRLIVVAGSETFEDEHRATVSPIWILDATDAVADFDPLGEPELLARWENPSGAPAELMTQSVHFFRQAEGQLYLSHYHGGVWKLDLSTDESRREARVAGYILPVPNQPIAPPENCCLGFELSGVPMVFDVAFAGGHVFAADMIQGVSSVRFD